MRSCCAIGLVLFLAVPAQAQDSEARAILDKALKAHGDPKVSLKNPANVAKGKGKVHIMDMVFDFTIAVWSQPPDKSKQIISIAANTGKIEIVPAPVNGKKGWASDSGTVHELTEDEFKEAKDDMHFENVVSLFGITVDKDVKIAPLGETKVGDIAVVGLQVTKKGQPDVNLYFDKKTNLLTKSEHRARHPITNTEENEQTVYAAYKEFIPGIKTAATVNISYNGKTFAEMELTEFSAMERLDDSIFAKPG